MEVPDQDVDTGSEALTPTTIRAIAIVVVWREDQLLVSEGFDRMKRTPYYRPLGGGIEPGERSHEAAAREMREEVGFDVVDLTLLGVLENLFVVDVKPGHEIIFVYQGRFSDARAYEAAELRGIEADGEPIRAVWRPLSSFNAYERLVPEGLMALLAPDAA
jgi:8-oxo-dGTP pyrophosphatase MutT (NUDIX family)